MFVVRRSSALVRMFVSGKKEIEDVVKGKGKTDEDLYFNRKDKELLKKLMDKLDHSVPEENNDPKVLEQYRNGAVGILKKHNIRPSEALVEDLMNWRVGH
jgi:hypothetical protein